jgi:hypothetical protein
MSEITPPLLTAAGAVAFLWSFAPRRPELLLTAGVIGRHMVGLMGIGALLLAAALAAG